MTRKRRRMMVLGLGLLSLGAAAALALTAFEDNLLFFYSPSDLHAEELPVGRMVRIGGIVEEGSLARSEDGTISFRVTDFAETVPVSYRGLLPDLFREGQGVVAQGNLTDAGVFQANEVLARHDENYMPSEVADALERAGVWRPESGEPPPRGSGS